MEETKEINSLEVIQERSNTGIIPVTVAEYFNLLPDPEKVAQRADATKKMLASLCKAASPANIVNFGGKPYFDHLACERIAKIVGLVIKINEKNGRIDYEKVIEDEAKNKYTIYLTGKVYYTNRPDDYEIQEGSSCSFDDWYKEYQIIEEQETEDGKKKKVVISANALPESKVREKARANLIQRLVKKFLGLDFTWEELEAVGIDKNKCRGFQFNTATTVDSAETLSKKEDVWKKILEICNGNIELAKKTLKKHTAFGDFEGYSDINKVKEKPLEILISKVEKAYKEHIKKLESGDNNADN